MAVITVCRQAGSGGLPIAEKLAETLGYDYLDYKFAEKILLKYGFDEFGEVFQSTADFWERFTKKSTERDEVNAMLRSVVRAQAHHDNVVILGRACFAALQGVSDVLNIRVKAPHHLRVGRVATYYEISDEEALAYVEEKDRLVDDFAKTCYGVSADDLGMFDLIIDTGKVDTDTAVTFLAEVVRGLPVKGDDSPKVSDLEADPFITRAVAREIKREKGQNPPKGKQSG